METGFKGYHPAVNLIFFASVVVFAMLFKHPITLAVCFAAALVYYIRLCRRTAVRSLFCFILPLLAFVLVINGLFAHYGTTPLLTLPDGNKLTLEAVVYGFVLGVSTVSVIMWFFCYNEVVTSDKFMHVFGKILPAAALVVSMSLRFVPFYKNRLNTIAEARQGLGLDDKKGSMSQKIKNGGKIFSILTTWSLENAVETSDSMRARGYGLRNRKNYSRYRWRPGDVLAAVLIIFLDVILAAGYASGAVRCLYNPYIAINPPADFGKTYFINELNLTLNPVSVFGAVTLAAFALLCFLPAAVDLKEEIKWNRLKSKI